MQAFDNRKSVPKNTKPQQKNKQQTTEEKQKEIERKINGIIWKYLNAKKDINWDYNFPPQEAF